MDNDVKQENLQSSTPPPAGFPGEETVTLVDLCSSDDSDLEQDVERRYNSGNPVGAKRPRDMSGGSSSALDMNNVKKQTVDELKVVLPEALGQSIPQPHDVTHTFPADPCNVFTSMQPPPPPPQPQPSSSGRVGSCKQFWKAGDYEGAPGGGNWDLSSGGFDHVRVHPKFLHSNATSHKWALGAFAELLDNALDEVASGATYVNVDMLENKKEGNRMLLIEDNGGGMDPEKMRQCMSLGYSAKSKLANTIGQYGNGFKTSTMRLGADVIVFSRCPGKDGKSSTQSIGLLSYTFLRSTGKEDIVVPMLDYERRDTEWSKIGRSSVSDWDKNVKTIIQWSPFSSEEDLLRQFALMNEHGTRIIIYNLWEDDQGMLELDFDADPHDIQLRGVNRDEKNIKMAAQFPNSRHFLTYKHSLRSYASILYLRIPPTFRVILRGSDVEHHNVVNDMMQTEQITYRPQYGADSYVTDSNMSAVVILGFVKDAKHHVDVQGFNVYHKNRLIKPFWRIWNATGSDGRGVIGVLEANFVEPAHDKQGFERTTVLSRLEMTVAEFCKNIVLAGVGSVTLMDDTLANEESLNANFLIPPDENAYRGKTVAEICCDSLKDFNPMVLVSVEKGNLSARSAEFFEKFDVVVIGYGSLATKKAVNEKCRKLSKRVAFYTVDCRDSCGEIFVDLQDYKYTKKKLEEKVECELNFPSFQEAVSVPWKPIPRRTAKLYFAMRVIEVFEENEGRKHGECSLLDLPTVLEIKKKLCEANAVSESHVPDSLLERLITGTIEFPPACAIIGGILAQEVIKGVSGKGEPLKNFFYYDAQDGKGVMEDISNSFTS